MSEDAYVVLEENKQPRVVRVGPFGIIPVDSLNCQIIRQPEFTPEQEKQRDEWSASLIN